MDKDTNGTAAELIGLSDLIQTHQQKVVKTTTKSQVRNLAKVRTGCITCKSVQASKRPPSPALQTDCPRSRIRRVKCDEEKPACQRCTTTGRKCDGYTPTQVITLDIDVSGNRDERRGFHFFRLKSMGEILGQQDAGYWNDLLLRLSQSEPAIKHVSVAIASLHESLELSDYDATAHTTTMIGQARALSLNHYNKAIQTLLSDPNQLRDRFGTLLLSCLLFLVFEEFQSGYLGCAVHLQHGLALLQQWKALPRKPKRSLSYTEDLIDSHMEPIFNRIFAQGATFMDSRVHTLQWSKCRFKLSRPKIPVHFVSFTEARKALDTFMRWMFLILDHGKDSSISEARSKMCQTLEDWRRAFDFLIAGDLPNLKPESLRAARLLKVY